MIKLAFEGYDGTGKTTLSSNLFSLTSALFPALKSELHSFPTNKLKTRLSKYKSLKNANQQIISNLFVDDYETLVSKLKCDIAIFDRSPISSLVYQDCNDYTYSILESIKKSLPDIVCYLRCDNPEFIKQRILDRGVELSEFETGNYNKYLESYDEAINYSKSIIKEVITFDIEYAHSSDILNLLIERLKNK